MSLYAQLISHLLPSSTFPVPILLSVLYVHHIKCIHPALSKPLTEHAAVFSEESVAISALRIHRPCETADKVIYVSSHFQLV